MAADVEAYAPFRAFGAVLEVVRFPYGIPIQELLLDAMRHLAARYDARLVSLNGHIPDHVFRIKILEWSTDWSNFFDAGREWWGTFCWTIEDPLRKWTTAILASATD